MENQPVCRVCGAKETPHYAKKNGFDLYKCPHCGLIFVWPVPDTTKRIYDQEYFSGARFGHGYVDYDVDKQAMKPTFAKYIEMLEKFLGRRGFLLDIGAATGFFINMAKQRGWQVAGVEISEFAAAKGREKGLDVRAGTLATTGFSDNSFDAVSMLDVIEHVPDPEAELKLIHKALKPGGLLLINNPDAGSWYAKIMGPRWHAVIPPEHLVLFNKKNLPMLLRGCGYEIVYVGKVPKKFSLRYTAQVAANWLRIAPLRALADWLNKSRLGQIAIPIHIRDNLVVIARKA